VAALIALLRMFLKILFYFSFDASGEKPLRSLSKRLFQYVLANAACLFFGAEKRLAEEAVRRLLEAIH
jgi:hypothetical protein